MRAFALGLAQLLIIAPTALLAAPDPPTAQSVIDAADRIRNPEQPFRMTDTLTDYVDGKAQSRTVLIVHARQNQMGSGFGNLVRYIEPGRDAGKLVLMDGVNLWLYDPSSRASIRLSPEQRLTGQASDGDVLAADLARDYQASMIGAETIQDADRQVKSCWHLDLVSANSGSTYGRIAYWVERETNRPVKGKFYADSGRLLKIAYYRRYGLVLGSERPTQTILIDAVNPSLATTLDLSDVRYEDIPAAWFQREFLPRIPQE